MAHRTVTDTVLAIDLGTSASKLLAVDRSGSIIGRERIPHETHRPAPNAAEQSPDTWWRNLRRGIARLLANIPAGASIAGIGVTGQMHGLVVHSDGGQALRPAITWQDRRSLTTLPGLLDGPSGMAAAAISPGIQAASWHWLTQSEPELAARAHRILLPKDEIVYRLTGSYVTDPSDAIGTGWFDPATRGWAAAIVEAAGARLDHLPPILPAGSIAGSLTGTAAADLGLPAGVPVVVAGGDAAAGAFGAGATNPATPLLMLSTGCQVLQPSNTRPGSNGWPSANPPGMPEWLRVATTLNGGNLVSWARATFGDPADTRHDDLTFLPYLAGERSDELSSDAAGAFIGLRAHHDRPAMARAAIQGVTLAAADAFERTDGVIGGDAPMLVGGGGVQDDAWLASVARVFGRPLHVIAEPDLSAWGAARSTATALDWIDPAGDPGCWLPDQRPFLPDRKDVDAAPDRLRAFQRISRRVYGTHREATL